MATGEARGKRRTIYLNNAASARLSPEVQQAGIDHIHDLFLPDEKEGPMIRKHFAQLIGANPSRIAIMPSTAFAITLAATNLIRAESRGAILLMEDQFNSAVFPWQSMCHKSNGKVRLHIVQRPEATSETWTDRILKALADVPDILVVCLPPLHWSDGSLVDLNRISDTCSSQKIPFIVDATQALGAMPLKGSVSMQHVSLLACSVHKWLRSPPGTCLVYIHPSLQETWRPLDAHGRGRLHHPDKTTSQGYPEEFFPDARKFDSGGKPNPILLPMIRTALDSVTQLSMEDVQFKLRNVCQPLLNWASKDDRVTLPLEHGYHLIGVKPTGENATPERMEEVRKRLQESFGIVLAVRCGSFRVAPYLDNTEDDMVCLVEAFTQLL